MFKKTKINDSEFQNPKSMKKTIPYKNKVTLLLLAFVAVFITLTFAKALSKPPIEVQIAVKEQEANIIKYDQGILEYKRAKKEAKEVIKNLYSGNSDDPADSEDRWNDDPCLSVPMDYTFGMDNGEWDDLFDMCFNS